MNKPNKFSPEVRERAVRLVLEHGCVPQTLLDWVKRHEVDTGVRDGVTTTEARRVKELEREVKDLPAGLGQSAVPGRAAESALGLGLH